MRPAHGPRSKPNGCQRCTWNVKTCMVVRALGAAGRAAPRLRWSAKAASAKAVEVLVGAAALRSSEGCWRNEIVGALGTGLGLRRDQQQPLDAHRRRADLDAVDAALRARLEAVALAQPRGEQVDDAVVGVGVQHGQVQRPAAAVGDLDRELVAGAQLAARARGSAARRPRRCRCAAASRPARSRRARRQNAPPASAGCARVRWHAGRGRGARRVRPRSPGGCPGARRCPGPRRASVHRRPAASRAGTRRGRGGGGSGCPRRRRPIAARRRVRLRRAAAAPPRAAGSRPGSRPRRRPRAARTPAGCAPGAGTGPASAHRRAAPAGPRRRAAPARRATRPPSSPAGGRGVRRPSPAAPAARRTPRPARRRRAGRPATAPGLPGCSGHWRSGTPCWPSTVLSSASPLNSGVARASTIAPYSASTAWPSCR